MCPNIPPLILSSTCIYLSDQWLISQFGTEIKTLQYSLFQGAVSWCLLRPAVAWRTWVERVERVHVPRGVRLNKTNRSISWQSSERSNNQLNMNWVPITQKKCVSWWRLCLCVCVLGLSGWPASGVMAQKMMSVWQCNRQRGPWVAGWHVDTWHPAITTPYHHARLPLPLSGEWVVLVWLHSLLPNWWVGARLCTFNDGCLITIPRQSNWDWGGGGFGVSGVEVCGDVASAICRKWHTIFAWRDDCFGNSCYIHDVNWKVSKL